MVARCCVGGGVAGDVCGPGCLVVWYQCSAGHPTNWSTGIVSTGIGCRRCGGGVSTRTERVTQACGNDGAAVGSGCSYAITRSIGWDCPGRRWRSCWCRKCGWCRCGQDCGCRCWWSGCRATSGSIAAVRCWDVSGNPWCIGRADDPLGQPPCGTNCGCNAAIISFHVTPSGLIVTSAVCGEPELGAACIATCACSYWVASCSFRVATCASGQLPV